MDQAARRCESGDPGPDDNVRVGAYRRRLRDGPEVSFTWYPFHTPRLISVPAAFFLEWLGSTGSPGNAELDGEPGGWPSTRHRSLSALVRAQVERPGGKRDG
ncbi:hypothetical protein QFZ82_001022 [Streptomyces sp. V4I23]|uniref:hypothetical protein n=1 Tax=Streptomyces sp. V4I23 TaxID=3042282 RepID=UPI002782DB05|nr:hypothetical protein [Streptomyces sp. V4I23]MDQ1006537.1 hypothetical protein [Streptomyces sp. V4I23]